MTRAGRRALTGLLAGLFFLPLSVGVAAAAPTDPAQWPDDLGLDPELTATPHTIRYAGADRYGTNLAMSLALRGKGGYPFDTSDRTSGNAPTLAVASGWWGAASCPRSIILVAGDTFADALSAASLSDPTDRSNQPLLKRVAATDPSFDPIGGMDRPDTASAPIVVTASGRSGASTLSRTAVTTATDLAKGGCTTAREAIIVGGSQAVPTQVETELLTLGFREVFRVAGANRYQTAASVATALGTEPPPAGVSTCEDPDQTDGSTHIGFYGNAIAEFRDPNPPPGHSSTTECRLLPRSVVLADGETGADALAAGWWTSRWQVPVLLTAPGGALPDATRQALTAMDVDNVIVLGGLGRIPEATAVEAGRVASASVGRVAGADRYATSVEMAKAFGGWYPGGTFSADMICVAASSGNGIESIGWPDALAGGPWCGRLSVSGRSSPSRVLASGTTAGGARPAHEAVPILLVRPGATDLPASVADLLTRASFPIIEQAFAVEFGGQHEITPEAEARLDSLLSEGTEPAAKAPTLTEGFGTRLDLGPMFQGIGTGSRRICVAPGGAANYRWLSVTRDPARSSFVFQVPATAATAPGGSSAAQCLAYDDTVPRSALTAVSSVGSPSEALTFDFDPNHDLSLSAEIAQTGTSTVQSSGARQLDFSGVGPALTLRAGDAGSRVTAAELHLVVNQPPPDSTATTFTGAGQLTTAKGRNQFSVHGLATVSGSIIELRGLGDVQGPTGRFRGGFRSSVTLSSDGSTASARWQVDGLPV